MVSVAVKFAVKSKHVDDFLAALKLHAANSLTEEGCKQFDICTDPQNRQCVFLYEVYVSEEAFAEHQKMPYFAKFGEIAGEMVEGRELTMYHIVNH